MKTTEVVASNREIVIVDATKRRNLQLRDTLVYLYAMHAYLFIFRWDGGGWVGACVRNGWGENLAGS